MRTPVLLYLLALGVRGALIAAFPDPAYPDSFYYVDVARALHAGQGFTVDFIWIFAEVGGRLPADPVLPIPSNAHWMPLATLVQLPFLAVLGPTAWASAMPFALIGSIAAPLTWAIARDVGARPGVAVGAGILTAIPALSTVFMAQPDNFSLFQPLVAGALWMTARGLRGSGRSFALAGVLAGLATLSRNDGVLVFAVLVMAFAWDRIRSWRDSGGRGPAISWSAASLAVALFLVAIGPWWLRQLAVFGSLSPSTASGKVLLIRDLGEWNSITTPATLDRLLGMGIGPLIISRLGGLVAALGIYVTLIGGLVLVPLALIGGWARRRSAHFGPFFLYAALLFAFSGLVSAVHVPGGTFIHSAVALAPHTYILALEGIAIGVMWMAARRHSWDPAKATRFFQSAAIVFAVVGAVAFAAAAHGSWGAKRDRAMAVADTLTSVGAPDSDRIMSTDPGGARYWTGRGGVVLVNDDLDTIAQVATAYDIRWLVLERADTVAAMAPILGGGVRPSWIGDPVLTLPSAEGVPRLTLHPVCTEPTDQRCTSGIAAR